MSSPESRVLWAAARQVHFFQAASPTPSLSCVPHSHIPKSSTSTSYVSFTRSSITFMHHTESYPSYPSCQQPSSQPASFAAPPATPADSPRGLQKGLAAWANLHAAELLFSSTSTSHRRLTRSASIDYEPHGFQRAARRAVIAAVSSTWQAC